MAQYHNLEVLETTEFVSHSLGGWSQRSGSQHGLVLVRTLFQVAPQEGSAALCVQVHYH